jgi:hypothetical protein
VKSSITHLKNEAALWFLLTFDSQPVSGPILKKGLMGQDEGWLTFTIRKI